MKSRFIRCNTCLAVLALALSGGCKSAEQRQRDKTHATFRLHLEVNPDASARHKTIEISGVKMVVSDSAFLDEANLERAAVVNTPDGGYAVEVQYDRHGTLVLEGATTANRGRHLGIFTEFGVRKSVTARWLAAPLIARRFTDGLLVFTPNATREEADQIVLGLNNVVKKTQKQSRF